MSRMLLQYVNQMAVIDENNLLFCDSTLVLVGAAVATFSD